MTVKTSVTPAVDFALDAWGKAILDGSGGVDARVRANEEISRAIDVWRRLALAYKAIRDADMEQERRPTMPDRGTVERAERREDALAEALAAVRRVDARGSDRVDMRQPDQRRAIENARAGARQAKQQAQSLLVHYFTMALPGAEVGEIEDIATNIIDAATLTATAERLEAEQVA